jgi:ring-1,2-phenylacetyl-CoA epoxidase subunit PaaD
MTDTATIWKILETVTDPEIPVLSITDLGIVRNVEVTGNKAIITITPTYTGCPAMDVISMNIRMAMLQQQIPLVEINTVLSPAWTTDWITPAGKDKLKAYGIAPPVSRDSTVIQCPQCGSLNTSLLSWFGSTACKSLYQCSDCREPFDHFKCH